MLRIKQDIRPIRALHDGQWSVAVGLNGITSIEAYEETGEMAMVPWFAVCCGEAVKYRVPARRVIVEYEVSGE